MERLELGDSEVILKDDPEDPYDNFEEVNYNIFYIFRLPQTSTIMKRPHIIPQRIQYQQRVPKFYETIYGELSVVIVSIVVSNIRKSL